MKIQGVILAAGLGSRMGEHTKDRPKCMVELHPGDSILDRALQAIRPLVHSTNIVAGYLAENVEQHVAEMDDISVTINPRFEELSNTASLESGLNAVADDTAVLLVEGDVIFDPEIAKSVIRVGENSTCLNKWRHWSEGSFVTLGESGAVKTWTHAQHLDWDRSGDGAERLKTINISFLTSTFVRDCLALIERKPLLRELPIEVLFDQMIQNGHRIVGVENQGSSWCEVDSDDDLQVARELLP